MNVLGSFEDTIEKGQSTVQNAAKTTVQGAQGFVKTTVQQVTGNQSSAPSDQGTGEAGAAAGQQMTDDQRKQFLRDLYGAKPKTGQQNPQSDPNGQKPKVTAKTALGLSDNSGKAVPTSAETIKTALGLSKSSSDTGEVPTLKDTIINSMGIPDIVAPVQKSPEEQAKIEALRSQLHGQYYQDLVNPKKAPEETVTEKLEREDQEEKMAEIETKKDTPPPINPTMKQGTGENVVGAAG